MNLRLACQHGGYVAVKNGLAGGDQRDFNAALGLDTSELFTFPGAIQVDAGRASSRNVPIGSGTQKSRIGSMMSARISTTPDTTMSPPTT